MNRNFTQILAQLREMRPELRFRYEISDALGLAVDLAIKGSLKPRLRPAILDHALAV